jgi:CheY-like chemotaxis protein
MPPEALTERVSEPQLPFPDRRKVAKVLLAESDLASRLTLKSVLGKAGYAVEGVASAAEAISKLDSDEYQLVLADLRDESDEAGPSLLSFARQKQYRPATALLTSDISGPISRKSAVSGGDRLVTITNEDISNLLASIAELISLRADRRMRRAFQS